MIRQLQWAITLGRYDILAHVMSMSRLRLAPKIGHLEERKLYMDILQNQTLCIRYRTKEPDYSHHQNKNMNGPGLSIEMLKKKSQRKYPDH